MTILRGHVARHDSHVIQIQKNFTVGRGDVTQPANGKHDLSVRRVILVNEFVAHVAYLEAFRAERIGSDQPVARESRRSAMRMAAAHEPMLAGEMRLRASGLEVLT